MSAAWAYYNEIEPYAAEWLRNLIRDGRIAPGYVDERSISDVRPEDLDGFTQCHFFAGIGVWSAALRGIRWPDDRPIWSGSCPCQPFSAAGRGGGVDDERHLWPHWFHLIRVCRPAAVVGEQVSSKDGLAWSDLVSADLEAEDYALGMYDLCAPGVGAPHIRQRLYFAAYDLRSPLRLLGDRDDAGLEGLAGDGAGRPGWAKPHGSVAEAGAVDLLGDTGGAGAGGHPGAVLEAQGPEGGRGDHASGNPVEPRHVADADRGQRQGRADISERHVGGGEDARRSQDRGDAAALGVPRLVADGDDAGERAGAGGGRSRGAGEARHDAGRSLDLGGVADSDLSIAEFLEGPGAMPDEAEGAGPRGEPDRRGELSGLVVGGAGGTRPGPVNGYWADADWLFCRDAKWRPVGPSTFPLAHGATARVGRLRAYGNAIVKPLAEQFLAAFWEAFCEAFHHNAGGEPVSLSFEDGDDLTDLLGEEVA